MAILPDFDDVLDIHWDLVETFKDDEDPLDPPGPRDENLVHSACMRPFTGIGDVDKYPSDFEKTAALFHSLTQNHAFHNGNKRTALVALLCSLYRHGRVFDYHISDNDVYEMVVAVANGGFLNSGGRISADEAVAAISNWLSSNTVARNVSPSDMKISDFLDRARSAGCEVRDYKGGKLIQNGDKSIRIGADTRQISGGVARKFTQVLALNLGGSGMTFPEFQNNEDAERDEIYRYMIALRRLAKI